jgi:hypothetical protein
LSGKRRDCWPEGAGNDKNHETGNKTGAIDPHQACSRTFTERYSDRKIVPTEGCFRPAASGDSCCREAGRGAFLAEGHFKGGGFSLEWGVWCYFDNSARFDLAGSFVIVRFLSVENKSVRSDLHGPIQVDHGRISKLAFNADRP